MIVYGVPPRSGTGELTEEESALALSRFHTIRPFLEDGVPLVRIAQENHLGVRTVYRWAENYRERGLAGLCRKARADKKKRQMSPTLQQFIEGLGAPEAAPDRSSGAPPGGLGGAAAGRTGSMLPNRTPHDSRNGPGADDPGS